MPQPPIERIISLSTVEIAGTKRALTWGERTFAGINEGRRMGGNSMNLKKNFQRFLVLRKRFGTGATLFDLVYRSLERSIGLNMYRIVGVNIKDFDASRWPKADFAAPREFGRDELLAFSGAAPDHLPREFVEQALAAGAGHGDRATCRHGAFIRDDQEVAVDHVLDAHDRQASR